MTRSATAITVKFAQRFDLYNNEFKYCLNADKGGVFRLEDSNFSDKGSIF